MPDYTRLREDVFDAILEEMVEEMGAKVLTIGDVYSILREELNNDILDKWAETHPEDAYPKCADCGREFEFWDQMEQDDNGNDYLCGECYADRHGENEETAPADEPGGAQ